MSTKKKHTLQNICRDLNIVIEDEYASIPIAGIAYNSKDVKKGYLFVAITGCETDGYDYIDEAIAKGAVAIIIERSVSAAYSVPVITVQNAREALAWVSAAFYHYPSNDVKLIGITGTNGKTSISYILEEIIKADKKKVGVIGTINYRMGKQVIKAPMTTPESLDLQKLLHDMVAAKIKYVVMEVSSHALEMYRVASCQFDVAIFTNLTEDHFDFHRNFENYFKAKMRLFEQLAESSKKKKAAVVNMDNVYGRKIIDRMREKGVSVVTFGVKHAAQFRPRSMSLSFRNTQMKIKYGSTRLKIETALIGDFNIINITAALAAAYALKITKAAIEPALKKIEQIPGRMEVIKHSHPFKVIIDYAHTEDALRSVLTAVRKLTVKRVICVFGCGGERDRLKRPLMGKAAGALSDLSIITSDNPRSEDPGLIIAEIVAGVNSITSEYLVIPNREHAIARAFKEVSRDDCIVIAGKGHEDYQILKTKRIHFSDHEVARKLIKSKAFSL